MIVRIYLLLQYNKETATAIAAVCVELQTGCRCGRQTDPNRPKLPCLNDYKCHSVFPQVSGAVTQLREKLWALPPPSAKVTAQKQYRKATFIGTIIIPVVTIPFS
jgi:hypothetical protein